MQTPLIRWEGPLTNKAVAERLIHLLFGIRQGSEISDEALRAEILRVAIWEHCVLSQSSYTVSPPVATTREILRRARTLWQPFLQTRPQPVSEREEEKADDQFLDRRALARLAEQGDLLALSGGQWLPAPLRLVSISSDLYLLVGGVPTSLLAQGGTQKMHFHGSYRQLESNALQALPFVESNLPWQFQDLESWLGAPPPSLEALRERFYRTELHSQVTTSTGELYVARRRSDHQATRWQPQEKVRANGRYLCKSTGRWGQRSYTVVQIERGRLTRQSQELASLGIRRLQYALDAEAKNPTRAEWHKTTGKLILYSELPARERKHLAVLGSLQANPTSSYYPRVWHITAVHEDTLREMLDTLAISLVSYV